MQHIEELQFLNDEFQNHRWGDKAKKCMCVCVDVYSTKSFSWIKRNKAFLHCMQYKVAAAFEVTLHCVKFRLFHKIEKKGDTHYSVLVVDPAYTPDGIFLVSN